MCSSKTLISSSLKIDNSITPFQKPALILNPHKNSIVMWKNIAKKVSSRTSSKHCRDSQLLSGTCRFLAFAQDSVSPDKCKFRPHLFENHRSNVCVPVLGFQKIADISSRDEFVLFSGRNQMNLSESCFRTYASVAEAVSHTDVEEDNNVNVNMSVADEFQELLNEVRKEEKRQYSKQWRHRHGVALGNVKYIELRRRQVKIETEAWEQAAREYRELLNDMCEQKLAPNLPYVKSLFLGWFEPFRNKIAEEQEFIRQGKSKASYAKYFDHLPADMMAVITMHKLMALLMVGEHGSARVVQAACVIGDAIEQEVG